MSEALPDAKDDWAAQHGIVHFDPSQKSRVWYRATRAYAELSNNGDAEFHQRWDEFAQYYVEVKKGNAATVNLLAELCLCSNRVQDFFEKHPGTKELKTALEDAATVFSEFCFESRYWPIKDVIQDSMATLWVEERGRKDVPDKERALWQRDKNFCSDMLYMLNYESVNVQNERLGKRFHGKHSEAIARAVDNIFATILRSYDPVREDAIAFHALLMGSWRKYAFGRTFRELAREKRNRTYSLDDDAKTLGQWARKNVKDSGMLPEQAVLKTESESLIAQRFKQMKDQIEQLPSNYKQVLTLYYGLEEGQEPMTLQEISEQWVCSRNNVHLTIKRALKELRSELGQEPDIER